MFIELIATIFAGIACAGIALIVNRLLGRRLPKWIAPVAAGLGMIGMTISNEYTWFGRTTEQLPNGIEIALTVDEQNWMRPWTIIWPYTKRFAAVDMGTARVNEKLPDQRIVDLYFFGRWSPVNQTPMLFDCAESKSALLIDGATFADDGSVSDADWQAMANDDPVLLLVCRG